MVWLWICLALAAVGLLGFIALRSRPAAEPAAPPSTWKPTHYEFVKDTGHVPGAARDDYNRGRLPEVLAIISQAEGYPASKLAMQEVRERYPSFAEAARHMQIVSDSLAIIEKTKVRATLMSRIEVLRANQTAMYDALPFKVDSEARASHNARIDAILKDGLERVTEPKKRKRTS